MYIVVCPLAFFSFGPCIVFPPSIYDFWLHRCYLQTLLSNIVARISLDYEDGCLMLNLYAELEPNSWTSALEASTLTITQPRQSQREDHILLKALPTLIYFSHCILFSDLFSRRKQLSLVFQPWAYILVYVHEWLNKK